VDDGVKLPEGAVLAGFEKSIRASSVKIAPSAVMLLHELEEGGSVGNRLLEIVKVGSTSRVRDRTVYVWVGVGLETIVTGLGGGPSSSLHVSSVSDQSHGNVEASLFGEFGISLEVRGARRGSDFVAVDDVDTFKCLEPEALRCIWIWKGKDPTTRLCTHFNLATKVFVRQRLAGVIMRNRLLLSQPC